jgi:FKBP-type peptidyl-prolyl cis-trans isomerase FklB
MRVLSLRTNVSRSTPVAGPIAARTRWWAVVAAAALVVSSAIGLAADPPAAATRPALIPPPKQSNEPAKIASLNTPAGALGYALGLRIGKSIQADFREQGTEVDPAALARGLADAILDAEPLLSEEKIAAALDVFERRMQELEREQMAKFAEAARRNIAAATAFLRENGARAGVRTLPSGLQIEVLKKGTGRQPTAEDVVATHYVGTHLDGTRFDGTDPTGEPARFPVRGVVPAWQEALPMMEVGSRWKLYVPPSLAYGDAGFPPEIEPNELLIFEIELVGIEAQP